MITGREALRRLREGNLRFQAGVRTGELTSPTRRIELTSGQEPLAVILGCSDSRVPAEFVFDQGLGDLFVIRVAGNIVASSQVGSVEFAAERFGTRLVVVMGHTGCGAIDATIEAMTSQTGPASRGLMSIVDRVRPSIESLVATDLAKDPERLRREAIRANVRVSVNQLRHSSQILERLAESGELAVVGAELDVATGAVAFFTGLPA